MNNLGIIKEIILIKNEEKHCVVASLKTAKTLGVLHTHTHTDSFIDSYKNILSVLLLVSVHKNKQKYKYQ